MKSSTSTAAPQQLHEFEFPLARGQIDLDQVSTEDLTRLISVFLGILAERRVAEHQR